MTLKNYSILSICCLLLGMIMFAWWHEWIIIRYPGSSATLAISGDTVSHSMVNIVTWQQQKHIISQEQIHITPDGADNLSTIISRWLSLQMDASSAQVQSVLINPDTGIVYLSFTSSPFSQQNTIYDNWMMVQALLKTIENYDPRIKKIQLLTNHHPLSDGYLDFTRPWPIKGF
jgi:hypothetical protein